MALEFLDLVGQINAKSKTPLNARQILHARAVFNESMTAGIDPRLAMSVSWQESTLGLAVIGDKHRGADHALGSMQVLRSTARGLGMEQEWVRNKEHFAKTGSTIPEVDAKMGVALLKELATKNKATTFGDITAAYNGGPKFIGKNYGPVQGYVQKVAGHMGKFFGGGGRINWGQSVVLAGGVAPTLRAGAPAPAVTEAAPNSPAPPVVSSASANPSQFFSETFASASPRPAPSSPFDFTATAAPSSGASPSNFFASTFAQEAGQEQGRDTVFGLSSFLPDLELQMDDPIDSLKSLLGEEYDKQYQSEDA